MQLSFDVDKSELRQTQKSGRHPTIVLLLNSETGVGLQVVIWLLLYALWPMLEFCFLMENFFDGQKFLSGRGGATTLAIFFGFFKFCGKGFLWQSETSLLTWTLGKPLCCRAMDLWALYSRGTGGKLISFLITLVRIGQIIIYSADTNKKKTEWVDRLMI